MRSNCVRLFALLSILSLLSCQKSDYREVKQYTIEQFLNTTLISGSSISHDEKAVLFSSNASGVYNAYSVPIEGAEPTQITHSTTDAVDIISYFPNDNRFLYRSDKGGNETWHIYLRNEDGAVQDLTPDEKARAVFYNWSFDDQSFFYGSNQRDPRFEDIYEPRHFHRDHDLSKRSRVPIRRHLR